MSLKSCGITCKSYFCDLPGMPMASRIFNFILILLNFFWVVFVNGRLGSKFLIAQSWIYRHNLWLYITFEDRPCPRESCPWPCPWPCYCPWPCSWPWVSRVWKSTVHFTKQKFDCNSSTQWDHLTRIYYILQVTCSAVQTGWPLSFNKY